MAKLPSPTQMIQAIRDFGESMFLSYEDTYGILEPTPYEEIVLWDNVIDNHGIVVYGSDSYTVALNDDVENYDQIVLEIRPYASDSHINIVIIPIKQLQESEVANQTLISTGKGIWMDRWGIYSLQNKTLMKVKDYYGSRYGNSMGLLRATGIKLPHRDNLLWDYKNDNNNNILYGAGTDVVLHDSIDNYKEIMIEFMASPGTANGVSCLKTVSVNSIKNAYNPNYFNYTTFNENASVIYLSGTTLKKTLDGISNTNGIVRVWGVNY